MDTINNGVILILTGDPRLGPMVIEKSGMSEFASQSGFSTSEVWYKKFPCFRIDLKGVIGNLDFCMYDLTDLLTALGVRCCVGISYYDDQEKGRYDMFPGKALRRRSTSLNRPVTVKRKSVTSGVICVHPQSEMLGELYYFDSDLYQMDGRPGLFVKGWWDALDLFEKNDHAVVILDDVDGDALTPARNLCDILERAKVRFSANIRYMDENGIDTVYSHEVCLD